MDELLKRVGWTKAEFARRFGISPATVGRWCRGKGQGGLRLATAYLELLAKGIGR